MSGERKNGWRRGDVNAFREEVTYGEPTNVGGISDIFAKSIDKLCPSERS